MNFLAHLYLSGSDEPSMIGNFIADSVKGRDYEKFPEGIRHGILLHRAIDHYSDNHPLFLSSVERLRPRYRKYAGVIVDIFYDHYLARNWKEYHPDTLESYASRVHALMLKNAFLMPEKSLMFLKYAIRTNRLVSYATVNGMRDVLYGMSQRARFRSGMETATEELIRFDDLFEKEFRDFFKDIRAMVREFKPGSSAE